MKIPAQSELNERIIVEAANRNSAAPRFLYDRSGGWTEARRFVQCEQLIGNCADVEFTPGDASANDSHCVAHRLQAYLLFLVRDDQPPDTFVARWNNSTE